jgi:hypothetical protein
MAVVAEHREEAAARGHVRGDASTFHRHLALP